MIKTKDLEEMAQICAELTRQAIVFVCIKNGNTWEISCNGF